MGPNQLGTLLNAVRCYSTLFGRGTFQNKCSCGMYFERRYLVLCGNVAEIICCCVYPKRYSMVFNMHQVEILMERNKREFPCTEAVEDDRLMYSHMDTIGCRPTHWKVNSSHPKCTTKEQMKEFVIDFKTAKYIPTC